MRINNIRSGVYSDATTLGKKSESTEAKAQGLLKNLASLSETSSGASNTALREILAEYNVTDITPRRFSEMLQKMNKSGIITEDEFKDLSLIRTDLESDQVDPDDSINLVDYYANKLRKQPEDGDASNLSGNEPSPETLRRRLDWLEKITLIQSSPEAVGLDAVA
jgi:hypothetical protein